MPASMQVCYKREYREGMFCSFCLLDIANLPLLFYEVMHACLTEFLFISSSISAAHSFIDIQLVTLYIKFAFRKCYKNNFKDLFVV